MTNDELKDLVAIFNAQDAAKELRKASIVVNGKEFTCYETGEIERTHPLSGRVRRDFGYASSRGYLQVKVRGKKIYAHRLVCSAFNGEIPEGMQVDHIDNDKMNNEINNLRIVTSQENSRAARGTSVSSSSKYRGVSSPSCGSGSWIARIHNDGNSVYLGSFDKEIDAAIAYDKAAKECGFFNEALNFPE